MTQADDDFTGMNFRHDGFTQMMRDVKAEKIDCVVVKRLDRLGHGTRTGIFIEDNFIEPQVRFIALQEHVDTIGKVDHLIDFYRKRIRASESQRKNKPRNCGSVPFYRYATAGYGYCRHQKGRYRLDNALMD